MSGKVYISADQQCRDSFAFARKIYDTGYRPDLLIGLWRGGTPIAISVHEFFVFKGHNCANLPVKCVSYAGLAQTNSFAIDLPEKFESFLAPGKKILVVDDVFDSGQTAFKLKELLLNHGCDPKIATLYYKPENNRTSIVPDFYLKSTQEWIVFPHELEGLTKEEIVEKDPEIAAICFD